MPPDLSFSRENLSFDFKDTDMKRLSMEIEKEKWVAGSVLLTLVNVLGLTKFGFYTLCLCLRAWLERCGDVVINQLKRLELINICICVIGNALIMCESQLNVGQLHFLICTSRLRSSEKQLTLSTDVTATIQAFCFSGSWCQWLETGNVTLRQVWPWLWSWIHYSGLCCPVIRSLAFSNESKSQIG